MDIEEAKTILNAAVKEELQDHAFGDREVYWKIGDQDVGIGYFGSGSKSVSVKNGDEWVEFTGNEAYQLDDCGSYGRVDRNDTTGPDTYRGA